MKDVVPMAVRLRALPKTLLRRDTLRCVSLAKLRPVRKTEPKG
jgi:hypothetical protein